MQAVVVRLLNAGDPAELEEIVRRWHGTSIDSYWYNDEHQRHTLDGARAFFTSQVLPTCVIHVATVAGRLAGLIAIEPPWIRHLAVFAEFRRHGVASALLAVARAHSPHELRLFTFQRNEGARAFYERHGFVLQRLGVSPAPESEPDVEYAWFAPVG
jgi:ribosomal protein S18 acetylase RimI-like enzyme